MAYTAQNQQQEGIKIALTFLKRLDINFPEEPTQEDVGLALQKMSVALSGKSIPSLIDLPMMTNTNIKLAMHIMVAISAASYQVSPAMMILLVLKQVNLSLEYGNVSESSFSYACYGFILCGVVADIESGYQFGLLSLNLLKQFGEKGLKVKAETIFVFNTFIRSWKEHIRETLQPLLGNYQISLETGDLEYAAYSIYFYSCYSYFSGKSLFTIEIEMTQYNHAIARLKQEAAFSWHSLHQQVVLNIMGNSNNPCRLTGEVYDENIQLERYQQTNDKLAIHLLHLNKCILSYLFQEYGAATENAQIAEQHLDGVTGSLLSAILHFYDSLARLAVYPSLSQREQEAVLTKVSANQEKMQNWAHHAPMNFLHKLYLVEAEHARMLGNDGDAREFYDKAIAGAKKNEYLNEEALANELAGQFYLEKGMFKIAKVYLQDAHYIYQQWGALAKVKNLETRYSQFLAPKTAQVISTDSQWLDLNSVMKASQTLSDEIVLSQLLEKMMHIAIENAGASIGFLLLPKQDSWFIEAQGQIDSDEVKVLQSFPIENQSIAETVIHYVIRTQENVVLKNASVEGQFIRDPYIIKQHPKSVLCMPLLNQGHITGILYLENNLTTGAFTPERIEVLNLLSSQIAISIENARLYTSISRFLPHEFLSLLDKKNIIDVQLGDQVEKEMSILFADIRDFTSLSEKMTPQENFNFINSYLSRMEPIMDQHKGFVDKYIGDAIMALFFSADDVVQAATAMLKELINYNLERQKANYKPISIGIGINTGKLMLGTVGSENRMDGTVISDAVNLASRIEGMTKMYGASLLISEDTYAHLSDVSQYSIRTIDRVIVKGKSEPVTVYEVFDGDAAHLIRLVPK